MRAMAWFGLAALCVPLMACESVGDIAGAVTGAASGSGSVNPAVGYAVGMGTRSAVNELIRYLRRKRHGREQDRIADAAGGLAVGQSARWEIRHKVPMFDNAQGSLTVVRDIQNPLAPCREVAFTVADGKRPSGGPAFLTTLCRSGQGWKWALAEPATERWGSLQ
jgi:hypothetical protein